MMRCREIILIFLGVEYLNSVFVILGEFLWVIVWCVVIVFIELWGSLVVFVGVYFIFLWLLVVVLVFGIVLLGFVEDVDWVRKFNVFCCFEVWL